MTDDSYPMHNAPRCGARTRAGTPCKAPAMPNGRCRLHGGRSLSGAAHGRYRTGFYTKEAIAKRKELNALLRECRRLLGNFNRPDAGTR